MTIAVNNRRTAHRSHTCEQADVLRWKEAGAAQRCHQVLAGEYPRTGASAIQQPRRYRRRDEGQTPLGLSIELGTARCNQARSH